MKLFIFATALLSIHYSATASERFDEFINPKHLKRPFPEMRDIYTSEYDRLSYAFVNCPVGSKPGWYGLELDTTKKIISFPGNRWERVAHFRLSGPKVEYLKLDMLIPAKEVTISPGVHYVRLNPMPLSSARHADLQCRWLRRYDEEMQGYPAIGLYCEGGPFIWNYELEGVGPFVGNIQKVRMFYPTLDLLQPPQNKFQIRHPYRKILEWVNLPMGGPHSYVLERGVGSAAFKKGQFAFTEGNCSVRLWNSFHGN